MIVRPCVFITALFLVAISALHRAEAQTTPTSDDPLRHGHALLIGNSNYEDPNWPPLDDVPLQLESLRTGLRAHFDTVEVAPNLDSRNLREAITHFLQTYGNNQDERLFIYYAGHGYDEIIGDRNELRGYITGIDTPRIDGTPRAYDAARTKAISMGAIRALLEDARAKSILVVFDSCFAGTIFTDRSGGDRRPLSKEEVSELAGRQARDIITAGKSGQRVPAHSPIPELLLAALSGGADPYGWGVISSADIRTYMVDHIHSPSLTPQEGKLDNPAFAEGAFLFRIINSGNRAPDESQTIHLYRAAADGGDADAQVNLGLLYETGRGGLPKDDREAARLYKLAADRGNSRGEVNLGGFYAAGRGGLPKDDREAARVFKLAADQGDALGQVDLGFLYETGRGGLPKDDGEAARLFKLATDQGNSGGQARLGAFYATGRGGLKKDDLEAARLYKLATDQGDPLGQANLGSFYASGLGGLAKDDREAARLYRLSADQGNGTGQASLGFFYASGRGGLWKDDREAARLFKLAADQGDPTGLSNLGYFYQNGLGGLPQDDSEAARLFKLAADQGSAIGQANLGALYANGRGGLPKDDGEAARLFKLAADQGDPTGQFNLGFFYENGRGGLPKDNDEAARLYRLAGDRGSADAQAALARVTH